MASLSISGLIFTCLVLVVCFSNEGFSHHHRHRYHYHHYYPYPPQPPTQFMHPAQNIQFTTEPGNCMTFQSYSPPGKACTYCICYPENWFNCWAQIGCGEAVPQQPSHTTFPASPPMTIQGSTTISPLTNPTTLRPIGEDFRPTLGSVKPVAEVSGTSTTRPETEFISTSFSSSSDVGGESFAPTDVPVPNNPGSISNEINEINIRTNAPNPIK